MSCTIVIADDEPITRMDIAEMLNIAGYNIVGEASDGFEAIELCNRFKPDLAIIDIKMPNLDGLKATKAIVKENLASAVLLLSAYSGDEFIEKAREVGAIGYIVKPILERNLIAEVGVAISKGVEISSLKNQIEKYKNEIEKRKAVDRAKGILMYKYHITEEEAYIRIRKQSMDSHYTMKEIAEIIIKNN